MAGGRLKGWGWPGRQGGHEEVISHYPFDTDIREWGKPNCSQIVLEWGNDSAEYIVPGGIKKKYGVARLKTHFSSAYSILLQNPPHSQFKRKV